MFSSHETLPQMQGRLFLTDGGIETVLIFHEGLDLPHFAAFNLLQDPRGREVIARYYERYLAIAKRDGLGFILESPTWRASLDWGTRLGYSRDGLAAANRQAIELLHQLRAKHRCDGTPIVVSGCVGPRGDGYVPGEAMSPVDAAAYHGEQIGVFAAAAVDMVTAITMTNVGEAIGVVWAAQRVGLPVAVSFTLETNGRLPTGQSLADAIAEVDARTGDGPAYFMINCAHPTHFGATLQCGAAWVQRVHGLRANASRRSHRELDCSSDLDEGDPIELARQYSALVRRHPQITVLGGCCGTDHRHIARISTACRAAA